MDVKKSNHIKPSHSFGVDVRCETLYFAMTASHLFSPGQELCCDQLEWVIKNGCADFDQLKVNRLTQVRSGLDRL
jgi:hypothetical protein